MIERNYYLYLAIKLCAFKGTKLTQPAQEKKPWSGKEFDFLRSIRVA